MSYLLGIDAGTTAMKTVLYDKCGSLLAEGNSEYDLLTPRDGIVETDPEIYWTSLQTALRQMFSQLEEQYRDVTALAISSQGESFITIDSDGIPLRNTIVWLDTRSQEEAGIISSKFGDKKIYHTTGSPSVDPTWASTKLLWMRRNEPELFCRIYKILFIEDYLIYRLTGNFAANGSLYCSSLLYDINQNSWWKEMLEFLGIEEKQLPAIYPSGVKVGTVKHDVATSLGFSNQPLVVSGGMDQACGCVGTGNIASGVITENTGSSLNISVTTDKPVFDPEQRVPCQTHAINGKFIYLPWCTTAGMVLKWFKDNFCEVQITEAASEGTSVYKMLTESTRAIQPGSGGVVILPHLSGAMSPEMDPAARCVIYGLSLASKREHIVKAILESVAYMSRSNIAIIEEAGIDVHEIILSGGASKSHEWNQIKADVLGKKAKTIQNSESCCLGAAILAGIGSGIFETAEQACKMIIKYDHYYTPSEKNHNIYDKYYNIYRKLYSSLKPVFQQTTEI